MKTLIIEFLTCISLTVSQQQPLSKVATIKVPVNISNISVKEVDNFEKTSFKHVHLTGFYKNRYKADDIVIGFEDFELSPKRELDLNWYQRELIGEAEEAEKRKITQTSYLVTYNNTRFVVKKASQMGESYYFFSSETKNGKGIRGTIQYKDRDSTKASTALENLLRSIRLN